MSNVLIWPAQKRNLSSPRANRTSSFLKKKDKFSVRLTTTTLCRRAVLFLVPASTSLLLLIGYHSSSVRTIRDNKHTDRDEPSVLVVQTEEVSRPISSPSTATHFEWKCWDKCSCLPTERSRDDDDDDDDIVYMHQSYKTDNQSQWPAGWSTFRQSWLDLHSVKEEEEQQHGHGHGRQWVFVFWLDEHNDLLAKCTGYYKKLFHGRSAIQRADLARLLYLYQYGGLYADMDYLALKSHVPLLFDHPLLQHQQILLQGRVDQEVGLEWGFARTPRHPFWTYCLDHRIGPNGRVAAAPFSTGPSMLRRCLKFFAFPNIVQRRRTSLVPMHPYYSASSPEKANIGVHIGRNGTAAGTVVGGSIMIVEPRLIAPLDGRDFDSSCGRWRRGSAADHDHDNGNTASYWQSGNSDAWQTSPCRKYLVEETGSYAVTFYSQSWNQSSTTL
jgi:Glycosyltransferase sugar-binding region containing DXD motif